MAEIGTDIAPASWQVTATTIYCDMVKDYATVMVYKDWSCKCTWWAKYDKVAFGDKKRKFSKEIKEKITLCQGCDCRYVTDYRNELIEEERAVNG